MAEPPLWADRVVEELKLFTEGFAVSGIAVAPAGDGDVAHYVGTVSGPVGTRYAGVIFVVDIHLPEDYPLTCPDVMFRHPVPQNHPKINLMTGCVHDDVFKNWSLFNDLKTTMISVRSLLSVSEPNCRQALFMDDPYLSNKESSSVLADLLDFDVDDFDFDTLGTLRTDGTSEGNCITCPDHEAEEVMDGGKEDLNYSISTSPHQSTALVDVPAQSPPVIVGVVSEDSTPTKLFKALQDAQYAKVLSWEDNGESVCINNSLVERKLLHNDNFFTFFTFRSLNLHLKNGYGFTVRTKAQKTYISHPDFKLKNPIAACSMVRPAKGAKGARSDANLSKLVDEKIAAVQTQVSGEVYSVQEVLREELRKSNEHTSSQLQAIYDILDIPTMGEHGDDEEDDPSGGGHDGRGGSQVTHEAGKK